MGATTSARLAALSNQKLDVLIIGGGIQGAGIAREASLHGLKVALFEKRDFASGTSGKTSSLIHGGIRYLEQGEIQLVREAVYERYILAHAAPHLVTPLPFLFPIYQGGPRKKMTIQIGMFLYDLLAGQKVLERATFLSSAHVQQLEPRLSSSGLLGAARFFDCQMDDARLCLSVLLSAQKEGAEIFNYTEVTGILQNQGKIRGVTVKEEGGPFYNIYGTIVVNAAGAWSNTICAMENGIPKTNGIRPTKGIHIVLPKMTAHAIVLSSAASKRIFFVMPWRGYSLVGTTDTDYAEDIDHVVPTEEEIAFLIRETVPFFPCVARENVLGRFAALRPLMCEETQNPWERTRREQIEWTPGGMLVVRGGKYTLFRKIAMRVMDAVFKRHWPTRVFKRPNPEPTLYGGDTGPIEQYRRSHVSENLISEPLLSYLIGAYGTGYKALLEIAGNDPALLTPLTPQGSPLAVEVIHAVRNEYACHLSDFMLRRTRLAHGPYKTAAIRTVAEIMGKERGWNADEVQQECNAYLAEIRA